MTFRRGARLNPGQLRDLRGQGGGGGRGFGLPGFGSGGSGSGGGGMSVPTGGGIGLIVLIVIVVGVLFVVNGGLGGTQSNTANGEGVDVGTGTGDIAQCQTGEDANARLDCRMVGFVNSIQAYWADELPQQGTQYREAITTLYDGSVNTGCGQATSDVGPFYCPSDQNVYIDLGFFNVLESQLGATNAPLSQAYVVAHEYGHHIQNLTGVLSRSQSGVTGPQSDQVRVELQADCYAGVWTANAVDTEYLEPITQSEIQVALEAARAVGDDRIQRKTQGQVSPETWTHGSSAQREQWISTGYRTGDPASCDTFGGQI
ncbi:MAG: neutral zinc metallopeptidase [Candidatus Limnocylindrales bacterium]